MQKNLLNYEQIRLGSIFENLSWYDGSFKKIPKSLFPEQLETKPHIEADRENDNHYHYSLCTAPKGNIWSAYGTQKQFNGSRMIRKTFAKRFKSRQFGSGIREDADLWNCLVLKAHAYVCMCVRVCVCDLYRRLEKVDQQQPRGKRQLALLVRIRHKEDDRQAISVKTCLWSKSQVVK